MSGFFVDLIYTVLLGALVIYFFSGGHDDGPSM